MKRKADKDKKKKLRKNKKHRYDKWDFFGDLIEFILEVIFDIV